MSPANQAELLFSFSRAHAWAEARGMGHDEALGWAWAEEWRARTPVVVRECLLAGMPGSRSLVRMGVGGLTCDGEPPADLSGAELSEAHATIALWMPRTTGVRFAEAIRDRFTPEEREAMDEPSFGWGGGWGGHAILGYEEPLRDGIVALVARLEAAEEAARSAGADPTELDWRRGTLHVARAIGDFIGAHADLAEALAAEATDPDDARHFAEIAGTCRRVSRSRARDMREAVQLLWMLHVLDETDSPGRIDQYLYPFLAAEPGETDCQRATSAMPVLDALWGRFVACRSWNVCLGGQTADGRDAANTLSFAFLDLQAKHRREAPNLSVRLFAGSDPALRRRCTEVIALGAGMPALYNDDTLVPALTDLGIPLEHARNYAMNGCMQVDIQGMSHMGLEDGELNLAKCLELALHQGRSPVTGSQVGPKTAPLPEITSLEQLKEQLRLQIEHATRLFTRRANIFQEVIAASAPHLYRSLFLADCISRGRDMKRGGTLYNHGQFLTEGVANTADALAAIRMLVFEERSLKLAGLVEALDRDWAGDEPLLQRIRTCAPRFGNDLPEVDALAAEVLGWYFNCLNTLTTWRGGRYSGGLCTFTRAPGYGKHLAAGADGRRAGETVADSCGAAPGRDRVGPTALLRSAARLPQRLATSGFCLNLKLSPSALQPEDAGSIDRATGLFAGYFGLGGQQLQVNVVDADALRAAQADPQAHAGLIVRVGGFSARFVALDRDLQDAIIARTEHGL
jgi:formate C-acetyltransferase